jgi:hypothetical protein
MSEMNKAEIVAELEAMAWYRLFNSRQWLADRETIYAAALEMMMAGANGHQRLAPFRAEIIFKWRDRKWFGARMPAGRRQGRSARRRSRRERSQPCPAVHGTSRRAFMPRAN